MTLITAARCDCPACRATHWESDGDPAIFSAHEVADAWQEGYDKGMADAVRRLIRGLTDWLATDEMQNVP